MSKIWLTVHGVGSPPMDSVSDVDPKMWMAAKDFERLLDFMRKETSLTFDDGFASCWDIAFPALVRRNRTAKFFVLVGLLGKQGYLSKEQLQEMRSAGMEVGTHGMYHRRWLRLDAATLDEEIFRAKEQLEDILGEEVKEAACPFGSYDRASLRALRYANIRRVYTSDAIPANTDDWLIPRYTIRASHTPDDIERIVSGRETWKTWLQRGKILLKQWR